MHFMTLDWDAPAPVQTGGLGDRLADAAAHATDASARQGAFEAYLALINDIGAPMEPFVALVLPTILDKCSDKVRGHPFSSCVFCTPIQWWLSR